MTIFYFILFSSGGEVAHSYGRLILNEIVITDKQHLQPPDNEGGEGRIECTVSSGWARFIYHGYTVPTFTNQDIQEVKTISFDIRLIEARNFRSFVNFEGKCDNIYHYLFLSGGETCITKVL